MIEINVKMELIQEHVEAQLLLTLSKLNQQMLVEPEDDATSGESNSRKIEGNMLEGYLVEGDRPEGQNQQERIQKMDLA